MLAWAIKLNAVLASLVAYSRLVLINKKAEDFELVVQII